MSLLTLDFETGLSVFPTTTVGTGNLLETTTVNPLTGAYSLLSFLGPNSGVSLGQMNPGSFPTDPNLHITIPFYIGADVTIVNGFWHLFTLLKNSSTPIFKIRVHDGYQLVLEAYVNDQNFWLDASDGMPTLIPESYNELEIHYAARQSGNVVFTLNGVELWSVEGVDTEDLIVNMLRIGSAWSSGAHGSIHFDDLLIKDWVPPPPASLPPLALFHSSPWRQAPLQPVDFDASLSTDVDSLIVQYDWNFGDGALGQGQTISHTYAAAGEYPVSLTVTGDDGLTDTAHSFIIISDQLITVSPSALDTQGWKILDALDEQIMLRGVNKGGMIGPDVGGIWGSNGQLYKGFDETIAGNELDEIRSWGINIIRIPLNVDNWRKNTGGHRQIINRLIEMAWDRGLYIVVCPWGLKHNQQEIMPWPPYSIDSTVIASADDYVNFYTFFAAELMTHPNVLFQIWNEPCWSDNFFYFHDPVAQNDWFTTVQKIITNIRSLGSDHLIIVNWGVFLAYASWDPAYSVNMGWVPQFPLSGGNLIYNSHIYSWGWGEGLTFDELRTYLGTMNLNDVQTVWNKPMMITEIGANIDSPLDVKFYSDSLEILNEWNINYIAWQWRGDKYAGPIVVIDDWSFTPTVTGEILKSMIGAPILPGSPLWRTIVRLASPFIVGGTLLSSTFRKG